jgi:hypothetical protein
MRWLRRLYERCSYLFRPEPETCRICKGKLGDPPVNPTLRRIWETTARGTTARRIARPSRNWSPPNSCPYAEAIRAEHSLN